MDECEQVEQKIDLIVPADEPQPAQSDESPPSQAGVLTEPLQSNVTTPAVSELQLHMSAAQMKPLPARFICGASSSQAFNRPMVVFGQMLTFFLIVATLAYLWAHHMLGAGSTWLYLAIPIGLAAVLLVPAFYAVKLQAKAMTELLGGALHPLAFFDRDVFIPISYGVVGDALQGTNHYLLAATCYGKVVRTVHPIDVLSKHRVFEREMIISLAYAGKFKQALIYADNSVRYAEYLFSTVESVATRNYFAFTTRTAAMAYELAGDKAKANELRLRCYESAKDLPLSSEARLFANLARAEAYFQAEDFDSALPLLQEFVQNFSAYRLALGTHLNSRAYHFLAICHAHQRNFDEARRMHRLGLDKGNLDVSTFVAAEGVCAESQILKLSGSVDEADSLIDSALKKLQAPPGSVLWRKLTSLRSKPSSNNAIMHPDDDVSDYDDEPVAAPILADEKKMVYSLFRTNLGIVIAAIAIAFFSHWSFNLAWILLPAIAYSIYRLRNLKMRSQAGAAAIASGMPIMVKAKFTGFCDLFISEDDATRKTYKAVCPELCSKLNEIVGENVVKAVAYTDDSGQISAIQMLGHYFSVSPK